LKTRSGKILSETATGPEKLESRIGACFVPSRPADLRDALRSSERSRQPADILPVL